MIYNKNISTSEAKYFIDASSKQIKSGGGAQGSYNLPIEFFEYAKENQILIEDETFEYSRKNKDGNAYVLSSEYTFELGQGVKWLIGNEYSTNCKFMMSQNVSNGKPQIYRTVYNKLNEDSYGWFVKLYDKNLSGNEIILKLDEESKKFIFDIKLVSVSQSVDVKTIQETQDEYEISEFLHNRIVFGAPGTGKSNRLEKDKIGFGSNFERVTFHPNYSYAQFVGTYKPVPVKEIKDGIEVETITYKYVPGPFMRTYVKSIKSIEEGNPKSYLLLIEEINRANVAAVFGDVFQLLDRKNGESEYEIETSEDMRSYLASQLRGDESDYARIKIPKNMYIWATMNSADQGVFPMDTAFKRRWDFEYIGIDENSQGIKDIMVKLGKDEHDVNWNDLRRAINNKLSKECKINEDKLLGPYFISKDVIKTNEYDNYVIDNKKFIQVFKSKILMYLYEDAAKQYKGKLFEGCNDYSRYSLVCQEFENKGEAIFGEDIFSYISHSERIVGDL